eukprot:6165611-Amphidinium_carterae.1
MKHRTQEKRIVRYVINVHSIAIVAKHICHHLELHFHNNSRAQDVLHLPSRIIDSNFQFLSGLVGGADVRN